MSNLLKLTKAALDAPANLQGVFEIDAFKANYVHNYLRTTGKHDGEMRFERERILFMKAIQANKKLEQCDRFSIYASFIELGVSGLTLLDGQSYIVPYGGQAQFQVGWKGRLEQMAVMPGVRFVNEPVLVWSDDLEFDFEYLDGLAVIQKHKPKKGAHDPGATIDYVYQTIEFDHGIKTWLMDRKQVLSIRDRFSKGYQQYVKNNGKWPDGNPMDPPYWVTDEGEAFKKTLVKRTYKYLPKNPRLKTLDAKLEMNYDREDGTINEDSVIDYGLEVDPKSAEGQSATPAEVKVQQGRGRPRKNAAAASEAVETVPVTEHVDHETGEVTEGPKDDAEDESDAPATTAADERAQAAPVKPQAPAQPAAKANPFNDLSEF